MKQIPLCTSWGFARQKLKMAFQNLPKTKEIIIQYVLFPGKFHLSTDGSTIYKKEDRSRV